MYLITSPTLCSFSASSSGISLPNSSSRAMTNSTVSRESAPKILDEFGLGRDLVGINAQLLDDDVFYSLFDRFVSSHCVLRLNFWVSLFHEPAGVKP